MTTPTFAPIAHVTEVPPDTVKTVEISGRAILVVHHDGKFFAIDNRCSHADQPLACGRVRWGWIACPAHGAKFDLATGEALSPPATEPIKTFAVRVTDDTIEVAL